MIVQTVSLLKVDNVKRVCGGSLHVSDTEVVPLDMPLAVEVRVQEQCVVMRPSAGRGVW